MLEILYAGCVGPYPAISSQFTLEMCAAAKIAKKMAKTPFLGIQNHSRSSMIIGYYLKSPTAASVCYRRPTFVPICNCFRVFRERRVPCFDALVRQEPPHTETGIFSEKKLDSWGSPGWRFRDPSLHRFHRAQGCDMQTHGRL